MPFAGTSACPGDFNLFLRPTAGGDDIRLTDDGKPTDPYEPARIYWSPDSRRLLAFRTEPAQDHNVSTVESSPKDQVQPKLRTIDYLKPGDRIAHLLQGKLMLIVGEMDSNVDPSSTMQAAAALEKANKDFDLVIIAGANHGAAETPYGSRRRAEFLTRNLCDQPDPNGTR